MTCVDCYSKIRNFEATYYVAINNEYRTDELGTNLSLLMKIFKVLEDKDP